MATNFWTKIAINAYKRISTRDNENVITYNGGFRGQAIQRRHFCLHGSKGRCHGNQSLAKIGKNITKMAITPVVCNISTQSLIIIIIIIRKFITRTNVHVRCMLSPVRLSVRLSVCNARAPYSDSCNFRQFFYGIWYLGHPLTTIENFTKIVPGEPLRRGS